jgi:hypothetical protein
MYFVLPKYVPDEMKNEVKNWILVAFSSLFFILIISYTRNLINITIFILVGAVMLSGVLWWIPTYVKKEDQDTAVHILIVSSSAFIAIVNFLSQTEYLGFHQSNVEDIVGGRRRR